MEHPIDSAPEHDRANHRDQLIRAFSKLDISKEGCLTDLFQGLRALGWSVSQEVVVSLACYPETVWEHLLYKETNEKRKGADCDLGWRFFTVYGLADDIEAVRGGMFSQYVFVFGRIGNTTDWRIDPPDEYQEDRRDVRSQMTLPYPEEG